MVNLNDHITVHIDSKNHSGQLIKAFVAFKTYLEICYLEQVKYKVPPMLSNLDDDKDHVYAEESSI
jgi:D-hexose-6-phosphate mutarotase